MSAIDTRGLNAEIIDVQRRIKAVSDKVKKDKKQILRKAALPVVLKSRQLVYTSGIKEGKPRDVKGFRGAVSATYKSGRIRGRYFPKNLQLALNILDLRKTANTFVGPKIAKSGAGNFGKTGRKVSAYYAQIVFGSARAFGKKVTQKALKIAEPRVMSIIEREATKRVVSERRKQRL